MKTIHDVIVIGGGTMGTAAAWALGRRGIRSLVLEQFSHVHDKGSHSGDTRIIRHAYAESPEYVPLVQRADALWQELEAEIDEQVLVRCGGLELAAPGFNHANSARRSADEHGLAYEWLPPDDVRRRWPTFTVPQDWSALYSPDSGFLLTEPALRGMAHAARSLGATILENSPVVTWGADSTGVWVDTPAGRYHGAAAIVSAGAWASNLLGELSIPLQVLRKTLWWQGVDRLEDYSPDHCPVFITDSPAGEIYGFPVFDTPGLKIANHKVGEPADPATVDRLTHPGENQDCLALASTLLPGVSSQVVKSAVCLYTMTPDTDFIVDRDPRNHQVAIAAGFSGHGFKFAPAIGELLAEIITKPSHTTLPRLSLSRFS